MARQLQSSEQTPQAVDDYIKAAGKKPGEFLFSGRGDHDASGTTQAILGKIRPAVFMSAV
jgi:hypothetical protein